MRYVHERRLWRNPTGCYGSMADLQLTDSFRPTPVGKIALLIGVGKGMECDETPCLPI